MVVTNEDLLRAAGPRVMMQRLAVLDRSPSPYATLTFLTRMARNRPGKASTQTSASPAGQKPPNQHKELFA